LLATLPTEVHLLSKPLDIRARSPADSKRLGHLARRLQEFQGSDALGATSSTPSSLTTRQQRAAEKHAELLRSKSNPKIYERQQEARDRLEARRKRLFETAKAQGQALDRRLKAAQQRHEEVRQEEVTRLNARAASASQLGAQRRRTAAMGGVMTMESWLPQNSDRWMGNLRGDQAAAAPTAAAAAAPNTDSRMALEQMRMRSMSAFERFCQFHGERSQKAEEMRRERQEGQQANLHRIMTENHVQAETLRRRQIEEERKIEEIKVHKRQTIDQWRQKSRQQSLERQELVVSSNVANLTMESWLPQDSDQWMAGLRSSLYHVEAGILDGSKKRFSMKDDDF